MIKHYLFAANGPLNRDYFEDALKASHNGLTITYFDESSGDVVSDEKFFTEVESLLSPIHDDLGITISFLCSHENSMFARKLLKEAVSYFPNRCLFITDVLMKEMSFGDYSSLPELSSIFHDVPGDLMLTAGTYLRCGLDACLAAQKLFIHRNTFNYRLNQFIDYTHLDIRDYHNALLLELYFQLASR
jgi:hypothetical protein